MALKVTTWNIENFTTASLAFAAKLAHLTETLRSLDPDVIALQEILDTGALDQLAANLNRYPIAASPDDRGNRVAFLFRSAPTDVTDISAWRLPPDADAIRELDGNGKATVVPRLPRPALQASLTHAGRRITFINVHLKSKHIRYPGADGVERLLPRNESERGNAAYFAIQRRTGEAQTVRQHATDLLQRGDDVVVLGDFNDVEDAGTTRLVYAPAGKLGSDDALRLSNVVMLVPAALRWSHSGGGRKGLVDHILASEGLMNIDGQRRAPAVDIGNAALTPGASQPRLDSEYSDHAPVTAIFAV